MKLSLVETSERGDEDADAVAILRKVQGDLKVARASRSNQVQEVGLGNQIPPKHSAIRMQ